MSGYEEFVASKMAVIVPTGIDADQDLRAYPLMPHQADLTAWALRRGRAAIFADTGLGKTRMQLAWADRVHRETGADVLILAPLAVAAQTVAEGTVIGVPVTLCREAADVSRGINITNYDRLHKFDPARFDAVVLDESSCIKHHDTKTLARLLEAFSDTRFKLCATATPAPNDWTELGTHAEFLGVCTRAEMLAEYFVHDGGETQVWRLKGHAREQFWRWVSGWGAMVRKPSDLGHDDSAYQLPPLTVTEHTVAGQPQDSGMLFAMEAQTLSERRDACRGSINARVAECVTLVRGLWDDHTNSDAHSQGPSERSAKKHGAQQTRNDSTENAGSDTQWMPTGEPTNPMRQRNGSLDHGETPITSEHLGLAELNTSGCLPLRAVGAQSAKAQLQTRPGENSPSIIVTQLAALEGCSASRAILPSPSSKTIQTSPRGQPSTFEPVLIWCELNAEQDALKRSFGDLAFSVQGSDSADDKESAVIAWMRGDRPVMISKPSIMGWGLNFQHCARVAFVGVTDSFEAYYQAVRRCWRFGQRREVQVHIFASEAEGSVVANLRRKEADTAAMAESLSAATRDAVRAEVCGQSRNFNHYMPTSPITAPAWLITEAA